MKKIRYLLIIVVGVFIIAEAYFRTFKYETLKTFKRDLAYIPDTLYGYRYKANSIQEFIWPDISKKIRFNNQGFYGPDFSPFKRKNSFRIIFVGNSNTLGIRTDGNDNFVIKLQRLFHEANFNVDVVNCSVDGKDREIGNMNIAKYLAPKFNPDLILFEYRFPLCKEHIARDVYKDYMIRYDFSLGKDSLHILYSELDKISSQKFLCKLYDNSYIIRAFSNWIINNKKSSFVNFFDSNILEREFIKAYVKKEKNWGYWSKKEREYFNIEESIRMYADLKKSLDSLNIKFATFSFEGEKNKNRINYPQFNIKVKWREELFLPHEGHMNNKGHELVAKELFFILTRSSLPLKNYKTH